LSASLFFVSFVHFVVLRNPVMTIAELQLALPEIFVLSMACVVLIADLFISDERRGLTHLLALLTLVFRGDPDASGHAAGR